MVEMNDESARVSDFDARMVEAREAFRAFLDKRDKEAQAVVLHDSDADGVTAGVVLWRALERVGFQKSARLAPDRERNAWTKANRDRVLAHKPQTLFLLDLGSRDEPVVENVSTCIIDHHRPEGSPPNATLISGYTWRPVPNTSLIVYELCRAVAYVDDLEWIACLGTLSDLGERAGFEIVARAKKRYKAKWLKEATTLVNAARRASSYDPELAARALMMHESPQSLVESSSEEVEALRAARIEVKAALDEAKKAAPVFSGQVALVRMSTPCQIHPLVAQIWRTRLPKYIVIAANEGYLPGRINFSARSPDNVNLLEFFSAIELSDGEGTFGHGHDQASGGSLPVARWNELLTILGFPLSVHKQAH